MKKSDILLKIATQKLGNVKFICNEKEGEVGLCFIDAQYLDNPYLSNEYSSTYLPEKHKRNLTCNNNKIKEEIDYLKSLYDNYPLSFEYFIDEYILTENNLHWKKFCRNKKFFESTTLNDTFQVSTKILDYVKLKNNQTSSINRHIDELIAELLIHSSEINKIEDINT